MALIKAPDRKTIYGLGLRRLREERGWSQRKLAMLAGVHQSYVSGVELGTYANPGADTLARIGAAFGIEGGAFISQLEQAANRPEKAA